MKIFENVCLDAIEWKEMFVEKAYNRLQTFDSSICFAVYGERFALCF